MILPSGLSTAPNGVINWNEIYNADFTIIDERIKNILTDPLASSEDLHLNFSTDDGSSEVNFTNSGGVNVLNVNSDGKLTIKDIKIENAPQITKLQQSATLTDVADKVNEIITQLENMGVLNDTNQ